MKTLFNIVATTDDALEALKGCEYALRDALRTDRIGWIQQVAHKNAVAALEKVNLEAVKSAAALDVITSPLLQKTLRRRRRPVGGDCPEAAPDAQSGATP